MKEYIIQNEKLMSEWNWEKNTNYDPKKLTISSGKKVWWKCEKRHEWQATIANRNSGRGCPICSNRKILAGYNDLATLNPELAKEWNYEKNINLNPTMIAPNSHHKVWWICNHGHEWQAVVSSRNRGTGCPVCTKEMHTSFPEQAIYFYIKKLFPDAINSDNHLGMELDIYLPSQKVAIEYDGVFWHKNKKSDEIKNKLCRKNKILLIRVKENTEVYRIESKYLMLVPCKYSDEGIESAISIITQFLNKYIDVDLNRDRMNIYTTFINNKKEHSLSMINSELAQEWNYNKNINLQPDMVSANSNKKVWWKCKNGHEWQATINSRNSGNGCPFCSGNYIVKGVNDLQTINPNLAKEWNYEKNEELTPKDVSANSSKKVWWKCKNGHEWIACIKDRNKGNGCPYCSNRKIIVGYNDLVTLNPQIAKEWNYEKNIDLNPTMVAPNSYHKVWWKCKKGHEWQASIDNRSNGTGCPYCSNQKILAGYNDLATLNPQLVKEWNYEKNIDLNPTTVASNSHHKVWWKCKKGHEWQATITHRTNGSGCPYCAGRKVLIGYNDLKTINPTLAKEWNYERNVDLNSDMVTPNSNKKVWWICKNGHEWQAIIANRNRGRGCPLCAKEKHIHH